jgi:hypothetical protein
LIGDRPVFKVAKIKEEFEAGITEVWQLLVSGRLKVMASCGNWRREFRKYHRDDKGSVRFTWHPARAA